MTDGRLFHAIVLMGAGLTGGGTMLGACGGASSSPQTTSKDAGVDGRYVGIMAAPEPDTGSYATIGIAQPDAADSGYANIMTPPPDSGSGAETGPDAAELGDAPADTLPDCYPCIGPAGDV
jgi:hypothetical protein